MNLNALRASPSLAARFTILLAAVALGRASAQDAAPATSTNTGPVKVAIDAGPSTNRFSPIFFGLMTEEINYSYEGGLYADLINNRTFKDRVDPLHFWKLVQGSGGNNAISVVTEQPLNEALTNSLKLDALGASKSNPVGVANTGFWGIPVMPKTKYKASFYARAAAGFNGPVTVSLVSTGSNATVFATSKVSRIGTDWKKYEVTLTTGNVTASKDNQLLLSTTSPGTVYFSLVSLFPPTYHDRANGFRKDIMELLADMHPSFLRFPGGNYIEGGTFATRFNWKPTVGDRSQRPGHFDDAWGYWSTDDMGLLEFLEWCEDLKMQPVLAVYAAYSMRGGAALDELTNCVQDALDEIEYVTGDTSTKWGGQRAKDGHPKPFALNYVEVGNEDNLGTGGRTYDQRFTAFHDAIKAKYPNLKLISTATSRFAPLTKTPDAFDDHFYSSSGQMWSDTTHYDNFSRTGPKIFVGEWATREGSPTPNMNAALGDAAWLIGLERNSDAVIMEAYAPLFVNVSNPRGRGPAGGNTNEPSSMQWATDLIGYDALGSYGSPAYYVQAMYGQNHGDTILPVKLDNVPTRTWTPPAGRNGRAGGGPRELKTVFVGVTSDSKTKTIYVNVVNTAGHAQEVQVEVSGVSTIKPDGQAVVLSADSPDATNSIKDPKKIVPVTSKISGLGTSFTRTFPPYSVTVLKLKES
jgi:alpha-N-arabinofuranosidase